MKPKAIVLVSGGLDSRLALKIMQEQSKNFDVLALNFKFPFGSGCCSSNCSFNFCQVQGVELKIIDCTQGKMFQEYIKMVRNPNNGYGSGINPCIDCRIFILEYAKKLMKKEDFIVTGEVLGERPMSQHRQAMATIDKESKLQGKILRPLSAKILEETEPEKNKLVDRSKLFAISGRSRKKQMELAEKYKIDYPSPAGGCLLCEQIFSERLRELFKKKKNIEPRDIELIKIGRHFLFKDYEVIVGRNHKENLLLKELKGKDKIFELKNKAGPSVLLQGKNGEDKAKELLLKYSKEKDEIIEK
jgi:tRNA-uridine 2-sulfurtransferase